MFLRKALAAALTGTSLIFQHAIAHSEQRNPLSRLARVEDAIIQTPSHRVHAHSEFEVTFVIHDTREQVRLTLEPNHDIFSEDATIQYLDADGNVDRIEPISRRDHKVFRGTSFVRREGESDFKSAGWARISVHQDGAEPIFDGVFSLRDNLHHVQTSTHFRRTAVAGDPEIEETDAEYMIVWRDSDLTTPAHTDLRRDVGGAAGCTADQLLYNQDENNLVYRSLAEPKEERDMSPWHLSPRALFGRQDIPGGTGAGVNLANSIGKTDGCPTTRKVALVGIAMDCTYTSSFSNREEARRNVIQLVSSASQLYESSFNISLAIQNMTVNDGPCPGTPSAAAPWNVGCSNNVKIQDRLNMFSQWRGQWRDTNAYWTLLTTCGTDNAVGLAWLGSVCQQGALTTRSNETTASANVVVKTSTEWLVFAHETGHTFGAVHDCNQESCSDGTVQRQQCCPLAANTCDASSRFIMNPSTGSGITRFSACTIGNVCGFLGSSTNRGQCLSNNRGLVTITGSQCGNGIVEGDEECDCGGDQGCAGNTCCDPKTCKFTANSQCDPANEECCTRQCRFMDAGAVCRASTGVCDPQEVCSGTSATCPSDTSSPDGTGCGDGLACASGQCTSRDLQCKVMMGSLSTSNDTYSCSSSGCSLSCASPSFGPRTCYTMPQYFLDGTPCEGGGRCSNGNCQGASLGQQILAWINDNKPIFIPVVIIVGLLLLAAFISCIWSCCRRRRPTHVRVPKAPPPPVWGPPPMGPPGYGPPVQGQRWEPMRSRSFRYA